MMGYFKVSFVFDHTIISATVLADSEDLAPDVAADTICDDMGYSRLSSMLNNAQDIVTEELELA